MRDLLRSGKYANLVESANVRREPSVDTKNFAVDDLPTRNYDSDSTKLDVSNDGWTHRSKIEIIKDITTCFPYRGATVLLLTFLSMRCRTAEE